MDSPSPPSPAPPPAPWSHGRSLLAALLLAGVILAAYHNTFGVPFLLDDEDSITNNPSIRSLATAFSPPKNSGSTVSGRPLLNFSLALNRRISGDSLAGYHAGNLLIHTAAALCLFGLVRRTLRQPVLAPRFGAQADWLAWTAAALWALHPLQTQSVTYLIQRAESLVGLCYLFTLYAFVRGVTAPARTWQGVAVLAGFAGMAAKEVMASAPLVLLLYDRTFVSGTFRAAWARHRGLHLAFASGWLLLLALIVSSGGRGSTVGFDQVGPLEYLLMQGPGIATYLARVVWPVGLVFDYGAVVEKRPLVLLAGVLLVAGLLAATLILLRRRPAAGFVGACLFLILGPTSSFIPVATQTLSEHRMYLPLAALLTAGVLLLHRLGRLAGPVAGTLLLAYGLVTCARNCDYGSPLTLWTDTVDKVPDNIRALNNLAVVHTQADRLDEATACLTRALALAPDFADAHANLGAVQMRQALGGAGRQETFDNGEFFAPRRGAGHRDEAGITRALDSFRRACELAPAKALLFSLYANGLLDAGRTEAALPVFVRAAELAPGTAAYHYDLANLYLRLERYPEAETRYQAALRLIPDSAETLTNYGLLLRRQHRLPESLARLREAARLQPRSARVRSNLGVTLLAGGATDEAIHELITAIALDPRLPQARYHLANAYTDSNRLPDAIRHLEILLTLAPPTAELRSNLGVLYARTGRLDEAIRETRQALALDPAHAAARDNLAILSALKARQDPR